MTKVLKIVAALAVALVAGWEAGAARVEFARDFAPSEGWTKPVEEPYRQDICLNGSWEFQPVTVPREWKRGLGTPPELPMPAEDKWEATRIKIPSPWNVNTWGPGRNVGPGSPHPYWPSSVYYPSYPAHWDGVEMGWLKRSFRLPGSWKDRRIILHFEAIGGHAQVFANCRKLFSPSRKVSAIRSGSPGASRRRVFKALRGAESTRALTLSELGAWRAVSPVIQRVLELSLVNRTTWVLDGLTPSDQKGSSHAPVVDLVQILGWASAKMGKC